LDFCFEKKPSGNPGEFFKKRSSLFSVQKAGPGCLLARVARWSVFKPKIPIWVNFGEPWNGKGWHIQWLFGTYQGYLVHSVI
jgi:hypothetical protein